jgi:hypothetical protein
MSVGAKLESALNARTAIRAGILPSRADQIARPHYRMARTR